MSKTTTYLAIGIIGLVGIVLISRPQILMKITQGIKAEIPRNSILQQIAQSPILSAGSCICRNNILSGPMCRAAGQKCSDIENYVKNFSNCICMNGVYTGRNCSDIGKSCYEVPGLGPSRNVYA
jgi:hypothetical protein